MKKQVILTLFLVFLIVTVFSFSAVYAQEDLTQSTPSADESITQTEPFADIPCTDSDGGKNYHLSGVVRIKDGGEYSDYCSGEILSEYFCSGDSEFSVDYTCPSGCQNGACKVSSSRGSGGGGGGGISSSELQPRSFENYLVSSPGQILLDISKMSENKRKNLINSLSKANGIRGINSFNLSNNTLLLDFKEKKTFAVKVSEKGITIQEAAESYIVEFKTPPMAKKAAEVENNLKRMKQSAQRSPANGEILLSTNGGTIEDYRAGLEKEHGDALLDIKGKTSDSLTKKILYNIQDLTDRVGISEYGKASKQEFKGIEFYQAFNGLVMDLDVEDVKEIRKSPYVKSVYPNARMEAFLMDAVPLINASDVWSDADSTGTNLTGKGIKIAIIDTGIDYTHPDLGGCLGENCKVVGGYDFVNNDNDPMDDQGHGTHCAGIAAGSGDGGLKGAAPDAELYAYKVLDSGGSGYTDNIISAIERAMDPNEDGDYSDHVDIISMSLGGSGDPDDPLSTAVDSANDAGILSVVAAGNSGPSDETIGSPGTARKALTVGATYKKDYNGSYWDDEDPEVDHITSFSSRGPVKWSGGILTKPDVVAPGAVICSAQWGDAWSSNQCLDDKNVQISGTSMATPLVAGMAALVKQRFPNISPDQIKSMIKFSSKDLGYDPNTQGSGRVNALDAINLNVFVPGEIDFGNIGNNITATSTMRIVNLLDNEISVTLIAGTPSNSEEGGDSEGINAISFDSNTVTLAANENKEINVYLNFPSNYDGFFIGKIIVNDGKKDYTTTYSFSRMSKLTLSVEGDHYPYFYVHDNNLEKFYSLSQYDLLGNSGTLMVTSGSYTVYAVNDFINPLNPYSNPETDEYILIDTVDVPVSSEVEKNFNLNDARKFTVKASSISGKELKLVEWQKAATCYENTFNGNAFSIDFTDPLVGDRDVYLTNKPDNGLNNDIIFKYIGTPNE